MTTNDTTAANDTTPANSAPIAPRAPLWRRALVYLARFPFGVLAAVHPSTGETRTATRDLRGAAGPTHAALLAGLGERAVDGGWHAAVRGYDDADRATVDVTALKRYGAPAVAGWIKAATVHADDVHAGRVASLTGWPADTDDGADAAADAIDSAAEITGSEAGRAVHLPAPVPAPTITPTPAPRGWATARGFTPATPAPATPTPTAAAPVVPATPDNGLRVVEGYGQLSDFGSISRTAESIASAEADTAALKRAGLTPGRTLVPIGAHLGEYGLQRYNEIKREAADRPSLVDTAAGWRRMIDAECRGSTPAVRLDAVQIRWSAEDQALIATFDRTDVQLSRHGLGQLQKVSGGALPGMGWLTRADGEVTADLWSRYSHRAGGTLRKALTRKPLEGGSTAEGFAVVGRGFPEVSAADAAATLAEHYPEWKASGLYNPNDTSSRLDVVDVAPSIPVVGGVYNRTLSIDTRDDGGAALALAIALERALCLNLTTEDLSVGGGRIEHRGDRGGFLVRLAKLVTDAAPALATVFAAYAERAEILSATPTSAVLRGKTIEERIADLIGRDRELRAAATGIKRDTLAAIILSGWNAEDSMDGGVDEDTLQRMFYAVSRVHRSKVPMLVGVPQAIANQAGRLAKVWGGAVGQA